MPMIHDLLRGHADFQERYVTHSRAFLDRLASEAQNPGAMFIGCADSRVVPELLTSSSPGQIFVVRNVANLVPPFEHAHKSVGAAVEFAVHALGVENIIVCGHTGCGGIQAVLQDGKGLERMPTVEAWLALARPAAAEAKGATEEERWQAAVEANVLHQLEHLLTYPVVAEAVAANRLDLHAWVYDLRGARLLVYDAETGRFGVTPAP